jgi:hypothetical protein
MTTAPGAITRTEPKERLDRAGRDNRKAAQPSSCPLQALWSDRTRRRWTAKGGRQWISFRLLPVGAGLPWAAHYRRAGRRCQGSSVDASDSTPDGVDADQPGIDADRLGIEPAVRELAEIPAVEVITRAAVMLMSAAAEKLGLADDGAQYLDRDEARRLITALAGLYAAVGDDLGAHRRPIADGLRGLQAAFRESAPIPDPPGQGPGEARGRPLPGAV